MFSSDRSLVEDVQPHDHLADVVQIYGGVASCSRASVHLLEKGSLVVQRADPSVVLASIRRAHDARPSSGQVALCVGS